MPQWWLEAVLPGAVFSVMFLLWVVLPARPGEADFGSRLRDLIRRR